MMLGGQRHRLRCRWSPPASRSLPAWLTRALPCYIGQHITGTPYWKEQFLLLLRARPARSFAATHPVTRLHEQTVVPLAPGILPPGKNHRQGRSLGSHRRRDGASATLSSHLPRQNLGTYQEDRERVDELSLYFHVMATDQRGRVLASHWPYYLALHARHETKPKGS